MNDEPSVKVTDDDHEAWKAFLAEDDEPAPNMAATAPPPGGGIAFSTRGYATEEEADAAHEAWLSTILGVSDEEY